MTSVHLVEADSGRDSAQRGHRDSGTGPPY